MGACTAASFGNDFAKLAYRQPQFQTTPQTNLLRIPLCKEGARIVRTAHTAAFKHPGLFVHHAAERSGRS